MTHEGIGGLVIVFGAVLALLVACATSGNNGKRPLPSPDDPEAARRRDMVASQIEARGIRDPRVIQALRIVPRHRFVPDSQRALAYADGPLAIGMGQTISQPYIVALMTELVRPTAGMKVLEIGTGSGYQAAVLAECVGEVFTIEILPELGRLAAARLSELGFHNVRVRIGDGFDGWPEEAPFDAIVVTAAPDEIPASLLDQLKPGGRLVIPVGHGTQDLTVVTSTPDGLRRESVAPVRFVPMTGKAQEGAR